MKASSACGTNSEADRDEGMTYLTTVLESQVRPAKRRKTRLAQLDKHSVAFMVMLASTFCAFCKQKQPCKSRIAL